MNNELVEKITDGIFKRKSVTYVADIEDMLLFDDSKASNEFEKVSSKITQLEYLKEQTAIKGGSTKSFNRKIRKLKSKKEELLPKLCTEKYPYYIGYSKVKYGASRTRNLKNIEKYHIQNNHEHDIADIRTCPDCMMKLTKRFVDHFVADKNGVNLWPLFLDELASQNTNANALLEDKGATKISVYFHNLRYDASSLYSRMLDNDRFTPVHAASIYPTGVWYSAVFLWNYNGVDYVFEFKDSLKLLTQSLDKLGKVFGLQKRKDLADYRFHVLSHWSKTKQFADMIEYADVDVYILEKIASELPTMFPKRKLDKYTGRYRETKNKYDTGTCLTSGAFSSQETKVKVIEQDDVNGTKNYNKIFDTGLTQEDDLYFRKAYYGGTTLVMPSEGNKKLGLGCSIDANSLYPSSMLNNFPDPTVRVKMNALECIKWLKQFKSGYNHITKQYEHFATFKVRIYEMKLKDKHFPCFPKKGSRGNSKQAIVDLSTFDTTITSDGRKCVEKSFTALDLYNITQEYDVKFEFIEGINFPRILYMPFEKFVTFFGEQKVKYGKEGNKTMKMVTKLILNGAYGKLAECGHPYITLCILDSNGNMKYTEVENPKYKEEQHGNIIIASYITAIARNELYMTVKTIDNSKVARTVYVDTDSAHIIYNGKYYNELKQLSSKLKQGKEFVKSANLLWKNNMEQYKSLCNAADKIYAKMCKEMNIRYDDNKFKHWKIESFFDKAIYLGAKRYIENDCIEGTIIKVAGVQQEGRNEVFNQISQHGIEWFSYKDKEMIVLPFKRTYLVHGGFHFANSYKVLKNGFSSPVDIFESILQKDEKSIDNQAIML